MSGLSATVFPEPPVRQRPTFEVRAAATAAPVGERSLVRDSIPHQDRSCSNFELRTSNLPRPRPWSRWLHWAVEARSHRVVLLVMGIWLLNGFDLAFTILSHDQGMLSEENPLARHMLSYGTPSIILFKLGLMMVGSYPLLRFRTARITEMGAFVILIAYAALAVHWAECYDLYAATAMHNIELARSEALKSLSPQ